GEARHQTRLARDGSEELAAGAVRIGVSYRSGAGHSGESGGTRGHAFDGLRSKADFFYINSWRQVFRHRVAPCFSRFGLCDTEFLATRLSEGECHYFENALRVIRRLKIAGENRIFRNNGIH